MRWSDERILTTHTGSLPRPPELTRLYVRRARDEAIDRAERELGHKSSVVHRGCCAAKNSGGRRDRPASIFSLTIRRASASAVGPPIAILSVRRAITDEASRPSDQA